MALLSANSCMNSGMWEKLESFECVGGVSRVNMLGNGTDVLTEYCGGTEASTF